MNDESLLVRRRIVWRAAACAVTSYVAALSLYMPWYSASYSERAAIEIVGIGPALALFAVGALASFAALKTSRRVQKASGILAIIVVVLLGPFVFFAVALSNMLQATASQGGDITFCMFMFFTLVAGIFNAMSPVPRPPRSRLPIAKARYLA
jgi:peptidoglycan/LPS O-acetylase OafA/YrhL